MKTWKKYIIFFALIFAAFMLSSCEVERVPDAYTTDISLYNAEGYKLTSGVFPAEIPSNAEVVSFYYYRQVQSLDRDYYLELKFNSPEELDNHRAAIYKRVKAIYSKYEFPVGFDDWMVSSENPYNSSYTDEFCLGVLKPQYYNQDYIGYRRETIGTTEALSAHFSILSYSYEELTVIHSFACYQMLEAYNEYNAKYFERFGANPFESREVRVFYDEMEHLDTTKVEVIDMTDKMNEFMHTCSADLTEFRKKYGLIPAMIYFYINVNDGGVWDIKLQEEWEMSHEKIYLYNGKRMRYDDHGNICFAYIGAVIFSKDALSMGAGINQTTKYDYQFGNSKTWYDDPRDTVMIRYGHDLYTGGN